MNLKQTNVSENIDDISKSEKNLGSQWDQLKRREKVGMMRRQIELLREYFAIEAYVGDE